jgi:5'-nucleotidase
MRGTLLILISNDDGVSARGLQTLVRTLRPLGRTVVVAPDRERSAIGHALTLHKPLRIHPLQKDIYSVNGTPTDCITLAVNTILEETPSLLISGINSGGNLGDNITYSGTVSAAMEGALLGIPSIAVSLAGKGHLKYKTAAEITLYLAQKVIRHGLPPDTFLNVNVPNLPADQIRGIRVTRMGKRLFKDPVVSKKDPRGRTYYWIAGEEVVTAPSKNSDYKAIEEGCVSVTPIHLDLTNHTVLPEMKKIFQKKIEGWHKDLVGKR